MEDVHFHNFFRSSSFSTAKRFQLDEGKGKCTNKDRIEDVEAGKESFVVEGETKEREFCGSFFSFNDDVPFKEPR